MTEIHDTRRVHVPPLSRQAEDGDVVLGRPELGVFISLPQEAVEIIDDLAAGATVGDASRLYAERHGEVPDLDDLLEHLQSRGLVVVLPPEADTTPEAESHAAPGATTSTTSTSATTDATPARVDDQFAWIPQRFARLVFGRVALTIYGVLVAAAAVAVVARPTLVPGWRAVYFPRDTVALLLTLMLLGLVTTFLHEMGHVVAARAHGVSSRFGIGNRLWFIVWETDLTGLWALPRRQRYLPILAGPLVDLVSAALLVLAAAASQAGRITLSPLLEQILSALLFVYLMRLLWQAYFFVRTDYYFALANWLRCKSLLADTEQYLRELWARLRGRSGEARTDSLPVHEQRAVRAYAVVWVVGRAVALGVLVFIQLPLFVGYLKLLAQAVTSTSAAPTDATTLLPVLLFVAFFGVGLFLWIRGLIKTRK